MKSELAKARDKWLASEDGRECCNGTATGQYLQNRLERAFLVGANFSSERIEKLEAKNKKLREAVALLNSMILSGEYHSDKSREIVEQALKA